MANYFIPRSAASADGVRVARVLTRVSDRGRRLTLSHAQTFRRLSDNARSCSISPATASLTQRSLTFSNNARPRAPPTAHDQRRVTCPTPTNS